MNSQAKPLSRIDALAASFASLSTCQPIRRLTANADIHPVLIRPSYFITRNDGTRTALIEVDQLPSNIKIACIPTSLSVAETAGMISLGIKDRAQHSYILEIGKASTVSHLEEVNSSNDAETVDGSVSSRIEEFSFKDDRFGEYLTPLAKDNDPQGKRKRNEAQADSGANTETAVVVSNSTTTRNIAPTLATLATTPTMAPVANLATLDPVSPISGAAKSGRLEKKEFCKFWILKGKCGFIKKGCLYKHEMPDEETLRGMGIAAVPEWYSNAMSKKGQSTGTNAHPPQHWRSASAATTRQPLVTFHPTSHRPHSNTTHQPQGPKTPDQGQNKASANPLRNGSNLVPLNTFPSEARNNSDRKGEGKDKDGEDVKAEGDASGKADVPMGILIDI